MVFMLSMVYGEVSRTNRGLVLETYKLTNFFEIKTLPKNSGSTKGPFVPHFNFAIPNLSIHPLNNPS